MTRVFELKEFNSKSEGIEKKRGKVFSFLMKDETKQIRVSCWNEKAELNGNLIKVGDKVIIKNGELKYKKNTPEKPKDQEVKKKG